MKVLMINVVCGIRSTGRICTDIATELEAQGHEVKIAYGRETVPPEFEHYAVRIGSDLDVKVHGVKARLFDGCGFGSKKATIEFVKWIENYNPDVIHLHNLHGYYINIEILFNYLKTCGKRIIWTLHDCWAFTGHSAYCDVVECEKWKSGCGNCPQRSVYPKSYTDHSRSNWQKKNSVMHGIPNMTIVTPSQWLSGLVKESFLSDYPVKVIHNGIDITKFKPIKSDLRKKEHLENKHILLGIATAWDEMKGLEDYIALTEKLDDNYQIILVGLSPKQKAQLDSNVIGIERTNSVTELAGLYSTADMLLNLSYCENYPTVNLEALACNTPVLTYNTGGSPESVQSNRGIIIEKGCLDAVAASIKEYFQNNPEKPDLNVDLNSIDKKATIKQYMEIYLNDPK